MVEFSDHTLETIESFREMNLSTEILHGIHSHGFDSPSAIQQKAINPITKGRNVIAQAQSGTGKTAAFTLGMLQRIEEVPQIQALVLAPTRELARQIESVVHSLSQHTSITSHCCIGGSSLRLDLEAVATKTNILIGTPGRLQQLCEGSDRSPAADLRHLKILVIDEADEMLSKGFMETTAAIFRACPEASQVVLVSATYNQDVADLANQFVKDPVKILVKNEELTLEGINQTCLSVEEGEKYQVLEQILSVFQVNVGIIYVDTVESCKKLFEQLVEADFPVAMMHSKMEQSERNKTMNEFKEGSVRYLVTTNLLARGIDVQALGVVINYDLPKENADYLHRVGRAGRYGKKGLAINMLANSNDVERMKEIEKHFSTKVEELSEDVIAEWSSEERQE